jgi:DNA-binding NtrC family response regulator
MDDLPLDLVSERDNAADEIYTSGAGLREAKAEFERHYILKALEKSRWNQTEAAKRLGVHRNTLLSKLESLRIRPNADSDTLVKASS